MKPIETEKKEKETDLVPRMYRITRKQDKKVKKQAKEKGLSESQIIRDIINAS